MTTEGTIARYQVLHQLGRGGMASVVHARDPRFNRQVAIKLLPRELLHDQTFRARFEREARTIGSLEHFAIVPVYDFGEQNGQPYLVMRFMAGGSLDARLRQGAFTLTDTIPILERIASALDYAHARGVIHRDLKPGNILFDEFGNAFLSDFGVARLAEATLTLTGTGAIIGTPAYMSPEQVQGDEALDPRCDVYALGIILFEMLSGRQPYRADTPAKLMMKHILEPVPRLDEANPNLPAGADEVVSRALAKDREELYSNAGELAEAARAFVEKAQQRAAAPAPRERPRLDTVISGRRPGGGGLTGRLVGWAGATGGLFLLATLVMLISGGFLAYGAIARPTETATPTATRPRPSTTPSPTPTRSPSPTAATTSPTPELASVFIRQAAVCRDGPGAAYSPVEYLSANDRALALGQNEAGSWWWIEPAAGGSPCWVSDSLVTFEGSRTSLPIFTPVPTSRMPTATATDSGIQPPDPTPDTRTTELSRFTPEPTDPPSEPECPTPDGGIIKPC